MKIDNRFLLGDYSSAPEHALREEVCVNPEVFGRLSAQLAEAIILAAECGYLHAALFEASLAIHNKDGEDEAAEGIAVTLRDAAVDIEVYANPAQDEPPVFEGPVKATHVCAGCGREMGPNEHGLYCDVCREG